jgi:hypothetical protein
MHGGSMSNPHLAVVEVVDDVVVVVDVVASVVVVCGGSVVVGSVVSGTVVVDGSVVVVVVSLTIGSADDPCIMFWGWSGMYCGELGICK